MNDVKRCSISGIAFTLEVEAWEELSRYLNELHEQYRNNPDGEEIIADIEARIAELILSTQNNERTVALPLVKNIIAQLGSAAEIGSEGNREECEEPRTQSASPRIPRRFYRDAEQGKLGGVCAGLANYFDIDPVWVRLLVFAPILIELLLPDHWFPYWLNSVAENIFGVIIVCYLIMWFVVPSARSARQRLEMRGERITADSIGQATAQSHTDIDGRSRAVVSNTVSTFGQVLLILLKILAGVMLFGLVIGACSLIIGAFALFLLPEVSEALGEIGSWIPLLGILAVLIPCLLIIYVLMCLIASRRPSGKTVLATFIGWILIIIGLLVLSIRYGLHKELYEQIMPAPTYNSLNLLNDPVAEMEAAEERMEEAAKQLDEANKRIDKAGKEMKKGAKEVSNPGIQIRTPEGDADIKVTKSGLRIDVTDKESGEKEQVIVNLGDID